MEKSIRNSFIKKIWNARHESDIDKFLKEFEYQIREEVIKSKPSVEDIINYIEYDAEIAIPINDFFNENKTHITKKEYGLVLLKHLCTELRLKFTNK